MQDREWFAWLRTFVLLLGMSLLGFPVLAVVDELRTLNAHLAVVEREVRKNTETQQRMEKLANNALKSFGNGIE